MYYPPHSDGSRYTPYAWIDGILGGYTSGQWLGWIQGRAAIDSPIEIDLGGSFDPETNVGSYQIDIIAHEQINLQGLHLRIALLEDSLYYQASNGTQWHNNTLRDMIVDPTGYSFTISQGDTVSFSRQFQCQDPLDYHFCKLTVWVQADNSGREVLQAASVTMTELAEPQAIDEEEAIPVDFILNQNYPNPFNASTNISYDLKKPAKVALEIYDLGGRKINTLVNQDQEAGEHQVVWNGLSHDGSPVASGVYFYRLLADDYSQTQRMVLLK